MGHQNSKPSFLPHEEEINPKLPVIPEDVIQEILLRLPAESLLKFRCISKLWRSLIDSKFFTKKHIQNITADKTSGRRRLIYCCDHYKHRLRQRSLQSYKEESSADPSCFDDRKNIHVTAAVAILVGHCNGVLCILIQPRSFFLWNPTTRTCTELPKLQLDVTTKYGFGWDEASDAYKVFAIVSYKEDNIGIIYSSLTESWKTIEHGCLSLCRRLGIFASGKIHWLAQGGLYIETFDLNSEVFGMMDNPCKQVVDNMWLKDNIDGCLCVVSINYDNQTVKIWSMKKDGLVKESWVEEKLTFEESTTCCKPINFYIESLVSPKSGKEDRYIVGF